MFIILQCFCVSRGTSSRCSFGYRTIWQRGVGCLGKMALLWDRRIEVISVVKKVVQGKPNAWTILLLVVLGLRIQVGPDVVCNALGGVAAEFRWHSDQASGVILRQAWRLCWLAGLLQVVAAIPPPITAVSVERVCFHHCTILIVNLSSFFKQVVTNRDTQETLLCMACVFEVSNSEHGAQHHIYRLVKDWAWLFIYIEICIYTHIHICAHTHSLSTLGWLTANLTTLGGALAPRPPQLF